MGPFTTGLAWIIVVLFSVGVFVAPFIGLYACWYGYNNGHKNDKGDFLSGMIVCGLVSIVWTCVALDFIWRGLVWLAG